MDRNLKNKLWEESPLTVEESLRLDQELEAGSQVAALTASLEDPAPSLAWRSDLNERLLAVTRTQRRQRTARWFSGFAATAALAAVALLTVPKGLEPASGEVVRPVAKHEKGVGVEESLVTAHFEADVESGLGVATVQTQSPSGS